DNGGAPVSGATVTAYYTGDISGTVSGVTGTSGVVTLTTSKKATGVADYCFEVTNVTHASNTYDSGANLVTKSCEGGDVFSADNRRVVDTVMLNQNSPNPFNPRTDISFSLPSEGNVRLVIYNVKGELVKTLAQGTYGPGVHTFGWDAANHPSGVYFYRLEAPGFTETKKMIMLK
ncbi:MAG: T9SS type A sorting domain-containing protein, partial [Candidatus Krumholzibacteria bacterium]|nr:T9SS type A sorting domain-containing protein [Candidatus Krumholzibacteria bacterium]